jgi:hypothetical protein
MRPADLGLTELVWLSVGARVTADREAEASVLEALCPDVLGRTIMTLPLALAGAGIVGVICLVVGILVLGAGILMGFWIAPRRAAGQAQTKLEQASHEIDNAMQHLEATMAASAGSTTETKGDATPAWTAADAARQSTDAAMTALGQVQSIVAALPVNLRFAGVLVLIGTVLIGVATMQFGGVSLF